MTSSRKLLLTVSCGILVAIAGAGVVIQKGESIKIRWYVWTLDSEDEATRKKAFGWLKRLAKENIEDKRLEAFFKHPESRKQLEAEKYLSSVPFLGQIPKGGLWRRQVEHKWETRALFTAVLRRDLVESKILLNQGADANAKASNGLTPLHNAVINGFGKVAKVLIEHNADVNAKKRPPMGLSVGKSQYWLQTPLHYAAGYGSEELVLLLLSKGAKVDAKDGVGWTPLDWAGNARDVAGNYLSQKKKQAIITLLRAHGGSTGTELRAEARAKAEKERK